MYRVTILLSSLFSASIFANNKPSLEFGLGVEYGGIGGQVQFPFWSKDIDLYLSTGLFYVSNSDGEEIGFGGGANYYLDKTNYLSLYAGTVNVEKTLTDSFEVETEQNFGASFAYKHLYKLESGSALTIGASYTYNRGDSYPFFSIGYRY